MSLRTVLCSSVVVAAGALAMAVALEGDGGSPPRAAIAAGGLALTDTVSVAAPDQGGAERWAPSSVEELFTGSDVVALGRVTSVGPGEPLEGAEHKGPEYDVPTERAIVEVVSTLATAPGIAPAEATIDLYATVPTPRLTSEDVGTGLEEGRRYILFLRESNQIPGRYWLAAGGTSLAIADDRVQSAGSSGLDVAGLAGARVDDAAEALVNARSGIAASKFGVASPNGQISNREEIRKVFDYPDRGTPDP